MFKKYDMTWGGDGSALHFYFHCRRGRNGLEHRAIAVGQVPRLDDRRSDYGKFLKNTEKLQKKSRFKAPCGGKSPAKPEWWTGQTCLSVLWDRLSKLSFVDMGRISETNPFESDSEPEHCCLADPEDIFAVRRKS